MGYGDFLIYNPVICYLTDFINVWILAKNKGN